MSSIEELWKAAYVANNEDEATAQVERQYAPFAGRVVEVTEITGQLPGQDWQDKGVYIQGKVAQTFPLA